MIYHYPLCKLIEKITPHIPYEINKNTLRYTLAKKTYWGGQNSFEYLIILLKFESFLSSYIVIKKSFPLHFLMPLEGIMLIFHVSNETKY